MLKKENRLSSDKDFQRVFKGSRPIHMQNLTFCVAKQNSRTQELKNSRTRFGFVISNKISKLATRRNALKRQLRAIIEKSISSIQPGYNIVIMVKQDFPWPYEQENIGHQVVEGLKRAGLL